MLQQSTINICSWTSNLMRKLKYFFMPCLGQMIFILWVSLSFNCGIVSNSVKCYFVMESTLSRIAYKFLCLCPLTMLHFLSWIVKHCMSKGSFSATETDWLYFFKSQYCLQICILQMEVISTLVKRCPKRIFVSFKIPTPYPYHVVQCTSKFSLYRGYLEKMGQMN